MHIYSNENYRQNNKINGHDVTSTVSLVSIELFYT